MPPKNPKLPEVHTQINDFLENIKKDAQLNTQLLLIQQSLENSYVKRDKITKMIWDAIEIHQKNVDNIEKSGNENKLNWTAIIQSVIIAALSAAATAFVLKGHI